jgi:membrane protein insertase Oxa1/YidC/SpoIIIJ
MEKRHKRRARWYRFFGIFSIFSTTTGAFLFYGMVTDWEQFVRDIEGFAVVQENYLKLNIFYALPMLMGVVVFLFIMIRKNREFFKDKASLGVLTTLIVFYLIYSMIELTLFALSGALVGTLVDEFIFSPLSKRERKLASEERDVDSEFRKEQRRIKARRQAQEEELNGTV